MAGSRETPRRQESDEVLQCCRKRNADSSHSSSLSVALDSVSLTLDDVPASDGTEPVVHFSSRPSVISVRPWSHVVAHLGEPDETSEDSDASFGVSKPRESHGLRYGVETSPTAVELRRRLRPKAARFRRRPPTKTDALCVFNHLKTKELQEAQLTGNATHHEEEDIITKRMSYHTSKQVQELISTHKTSTTFRTATRTEARLVRRRTTVEPSRGERPPPRRVKEAWSEPLLNKRKWWRKPNWMRGKTKMKRFTKQEKENLVAYYVKRQVNETRQGRRARLSFRLPNALETETDSGEGDDEQNMAVETANRGGRRG